MKKHFLLGIILIIGFFQVNAQDDPNPILTGAPFLRIAPDARAGGLGDQGVATSPDAFAQYWNPAKFVFSKSYSGVGISYTPYLSSITNDVFLLNGSFYTLLGSEERSSLGISIYYFSLGEVEQNSLVAGEIVPGAVASPNEFSIDLSYGLKLTDTYSMAVALRYIRSDLFNNANIDGVQAANSVAVDIAGYLQTERHYVGDFEGRIRAGFNIKNIGPKLDYSSSEDNQSYLPTNLGIGGVYDLYLDDYNRISGGIEANKLLVPTPVIEVDQNGVERRVIPDKGVIDGIFSSFGDGEDFEEINWSLSFEYAYNEALMLRAGYFFENPDKGDRQHLTLGLGFKYNAFGIDASYLIPTSDTNTALENTLRFALTWDFGGETYNSYDY